MRLGVCRTPTRNRQALRIAGRSRSEVRGAVYPWLPELGGRASLGDAAF